MPFKNDYEKIFKIYYDEYKRPLKYIDPRNISKSGDSYLVNEHNQTVSFYNAIRQYYNNYDVVAWFELSIGKKISKKEGGRDSTNAIDGIVYIPELDTLIIIESKGLRKASKFEAIINDFNRTIGADRNQYPNNYIIQMRKPSKCYAITLADIWGKKLGDNDDNWGIDFENSNLTSIQKCRDNYLNYKEVISRGELYSSDSFEVGGNSYRLLAMVYEMDEDELNTYTFKNNGKTAE